MQDPVSATPEMLLRDCNSAQREAVVHTEGPLLILAGPGSGKTRVVTRRAAHLALTVTEPRHILAITFTNKAAAEMRERVAALQAADGMTLCTFHALCARLLRQYHSLAGVPQNFTIFDRDDRRKVLKRAIADCQLSSDNWAPAAVEQEISRAKSNMHSAADFADLDLDWRQRTIARIYATYEELLATMGGLDFDDLLLRVATLLKQNDDFRRMLEDRFRYVLIDEYQDTNVAQYVIARRLTQERENICATGDPDQSIYGWRGADIGNILSFEHDYPKAKVVRLEQNYRSTKRILAAADGLIATNTRRKEKTIWTDNAEGPDVRVVEHEDGNEEAAAIAGELAALSHNGNACSAAIFYRVNSLSRVVEEALIREGVPYQVARGVEFYNRKEIKDILAYLRVLVNPADEIALLRIINTPTRGIGATTIRRLIEYAKETGARLYDVIMSPEKLQVVGRAADKVRQFGSLLGELSPALELPASKALELVISRSGLRAMYAGQADVDGAPIANLDELVSAASVFQEEYPDATVLDWLEQTALISDIDGVKGDTDAVTLMTLHAAKGLEFDRVYLIGVEEGLLPFRRREDDSNDEEEERRLLFVGMTRAQSQLTLSRARYRMIRGITERTTRSPFLDELPRDQVEWAVPEVSAASGGRALGRGGLPDDIAEWTVGTLVRHPHLGLGQVLSLQRGAKRTHADVQFEDGSRRSWVLEFAQLERVDFDDVG